MFVCCVIGCSFVVCLIGGVFVVGRLYVVCWLLVVACCALVVGGCLFVRCVYCVVVWLFAVGC